MERRGREAQVDGLGREAALVERRADGDGVDVAVGLVVRLRAALDVSLDDGFVATGRLKIKATDVGFEPYTAMLGALENRNQMTIRIELRS